ncbi:MAG: hypothetical protein LBE57_07705 [Methanosarcinales archaeon]|jgi:predicted secreted protein|nr:hypothetical protein [Methanosarcinales archaeon]
MNHPTEETIFVIAHCLLNPLARVKGIRKPDPIDTKNKKIIQLPCPELIYAGPERGKKAKEEYDTLDYRRLCLELFFPYAEMIETFSNEGYEILITGIPKSPSCGVFTTSVFENQVAEGKGIFFEEIEKELIRRQIPFKMTE